MMRIIALFEDVRFNKQKKELGGITGHFARAHGAEGSPMSGGDQTGVRR